MRKYLYVTVFFSGMASLTVEMAASRLLGNIFGTSNIVWASIIGLILIYLAAGYFLGGYWADRSPSYHTFYLILLWASLLIGIIPVVSRPILRFAANAFDQLQLGILFGSFASVLILFSIPVTLLGMISPFAIKLALIEKEAVGRISGKIYAVSTLGSFLGTFIPTLLLIPLIGTYRTFLSCAGLMLIISLIGLWHSSGWSSSINNLWMAGILIIITIWGFPGTDKSTPGLIYETESSYNYIQVLQSGEYRLLRLNEGQGVHSIYHPTTLNYHGPWQAVLIAPFFNPAPYDPNNMKKMAIVGLAAGTSARQATAVFGSISIDGYEIDPKIVAIGRDFFEMNEPNLNVIIEDGRWGLAQSDEEYQVISIDAYRPPYIPWHLTTREFFTLVHQHLTEDGVMVINIGRGPSDRRLIDILGTTIQTVFPSIYVMDIPNSFNSMLFATVKPTQISNLMGNLIYLSQETDVHPLLLESISSTLQNLQPVNTNAQVFTDDHAPVEWITNTMVLDFIFSDDMDQLQ